MIPIPNGVAGRPCKAVVNHRISITEKTGMISIPKSLWEKFSCYKYMKCYFQNYNLVLKLVPNKDSRDCISCWRTFSGGRPQWKQGKRLRGITRPGRYLFSVENDVIVIENAIDNSKYDAYIKEQVENFKLK